MESTGRTPAKKVFAIADRPAKEGEARAKGFFTPVGAGWMTDDGAMTLYLDALPTSGKLYVRDWDPERDSSKARKAAEAGTVRSGNRADNEEPPF